MPTESPTRSMAASLANIEAHRPSPSAGYEVRIPERSGSSAREYLGRAQHELSKLRSENLDANISWKRKIAELEAKFDDDLAKLNAEYAAILTDLNDAARRIQATRE